MFSFPDVLIHIGNILYLAAFMVRDIIWLRVLTVAASFVLLPYFYFQTTPLFAAIYWNMAFTALNIYWIVRLTLERRPIELSEEEQQLCELAFHTMKPREMMKLLQLGNWRSIGADECLVTKGTALDELMLIYEGKVCVVLDGKRVAELQPGQFIGGVSYITEETTPADVLSLEPTRYFVWHKASGHSHCCFCRLSYWFTRTE